MFVRERNWSPAIYSKASKQISNSIIESGSYKIFRVTDGLEVISFGTGSRERDLPTHLSFDVSGNYFDFDMTLLEPGYAYAFKFAFYDEELNTWIEQDQAFKFRVEDYEY